jgi:hypothetical protein
VSGIDDYETIEFIQGTPPHYKVKYRDKTERLLTYAELTPKMRQQFQRMYETAELENFIFINQTFPLWWFIIGQPPLAPMAFGNPRPFIPGRVPLARPIAPVGEPPVTPVIRPPVPPVGEPPVMDPPPGAGGKGDRPLKASGRLEPGAPGDKQASSKALGAKEAAEAPGPPLNATQQKIADSLMGEHPKLNPKVAADAARGGASAAGKGGKGADVRLLDGGGREVTVHQETSPFTADSIGSHLQNEALQQGTTEVYMQINSGSREGFLKILPDIRNGYTGLRGRFVKIFGPDGSVWWSGIFGGPK